ncbi:hypothetical protein [uncultured Roseovarius sp.]|uniref:hypothetical protein n=1 Tax=uncultured Roseovarius sp. TaxID=293344 RepID=UPI00260E3DB2|nr:hypothetical protein [uncultured Roseovarius sp.]
MPPTSFGKQLVAIHQYQIGKGFVGAAYLQRSHLQKRQINHEPFDYVVLHLFAQGIEAILKGLLLLLDFDKYKSDLPKRKKFGHNLEALAEELRAATDQNQLSVELAAELSLLNELFASHLLRYSSAVSLLNGPNLISIKRLEKRVAALIRLVDFEISKLNVETIW